MSQSELLSASQTSEGAFSSPASTSHESVVSIPDVGLGRCQRGNPSGTSPVEVVVICLPCANGWQNGDLAGQLAARLRGLDGVGAVRILADHGGPNRDRANMPITSRAMSQSQQAPASDGRTLLTLLFTDIVGSTGMVDRLGDGVWRALLARHNAIVRTQLTVFGGNEVENAGDGFFATFDRPTRAVRCAESIRAKLQSLDMLIRAAVHTAECETGGEFVSGVAVHVAARMVSVAQPGEIVVSSTVRDLVSGSGLEFSMGKWHTLRGLSRRSRLYVLK